MLTREQVITAQLMENHALTSEYWYNLSLSKNISPKKRAIFRKRSHFYTDLLIDLIMEQPIEVTEMARHYVDLTKSGAHRYGDPVLAIWQFDKLEYRYVFQTDALSRDWNGII